MALAAANNHRSVEAPAGRDCATLEIEPRETRVSGYRMHSLRARARDAGTLGSADPKPVLVLLHGILGAACCWRPALGQLARHSTVIAVDALGVGGSERVLGLDASLRASADRLAEFLDAEGIESADIAGTSHGGAVAMTFAGHYPERVRSLVLHAPANPFCRRSVPSVRFYCTPLGQWVARQIPGMPRSMQSIALERMYGDPKQVQQGALENYVTSLKIPGTIDYILAVLGSWFRDMAELKHLLPSIRTIPTRLLWGTLDRAVSLSSGEALAEALGAELVVMPGAGHVPYEEVPEAYAERVNEFLLKQAREPARKREASGRRPSHPRAMLNTA
jgi:4,5:9,10-diseco-3-hydroxy-5,9,17-trioxoandrosta-1(10),2-diene-4-oate hydrolase